MRHQIGRLISFFAYWLGVDALFFWLNRKAKRILTFHNVLPDELYRDTLANGVSNRLSDFKRIIGECGKRFGFSNDLSDASTLTVTFDDGYHCQYSTAFKTLRDMGIPAYVFVAGDVESGEGLVIDRLLHWVAEAPQELIPRGNRLQYWVKSVWPRFMADSDEKGLGLLRELNGMYPYDRIISSLPSEYVRERLSGITEAERQEMRNCGWQIGWHTKFHYPVSRLADSDLLITMDAPAEYRGVCLSYPFGNVVEVGCKAIELAKSLGYPSAVSNTCGQPENESKWFLPRMSFDAADRYTVNFELSGLKYFLKNHRLLSCLSM